MKIRGIPIEIKEYVRKLNLYSILAKKSPFLLGRRGTGKTTLIARTLKDVVSYDLLDADIFADLVRNPKLIHEQNPEPSRWIVIDEIQKYPPLLDEVQRLIQ